MAEMRRSYEGAHGMQMVGHAANEKGRVENDEATRRNAHMPAPPPFKPNQQSDLLQ